MNNPLTDPEKLMNTILERTSNPHGAGFVDGSEVGAAAEALEAFGTVAARLKQQGYQVKITLKSPALYAVAPGSKYKVSVLASANHEFAVARAAQPNADERELHDKYVRLLAR